MPTPRIYSATPLTPDTVMMLDEYGRRHAIQVLRLRESDPLTLFDGTGGEFPAAVEIIDRQTVSVRTAQPEFPERESPLKLHLFQGISKGERMDYAIQKATESGVAEITPLICERTVVRLDRKRLEKRLLHWRKVAISACEQCGRNQIPQIHEPRLFQNFLSSLDSDPIEHGFVLDAVAKSKFSGFPLSQQTIGRVGIIVGPEGGLSRQEIAAAEEAGFNGVQMGPRILRTETASVVAIAIMQSLWGDL